MELEEIKEDILEGKIQGIAKAISWVEKNAPEGKEIVKKVYGDAGVGHVIGITGFPGVGKSTLVSKISELFREDGKTVGIVATDPSSPFTGGALLGDRLRLSGHDSGSDLWTDPGVFYRSVSTKGRPGGISQVTGDIITILDAAGFDKIIIETAGAGQSEVDVVEVVDTSVVVLMPSVGDKIQFGKAGIMEIADIFVVNKSDLKGASEVERFLKEMQSLNQTVNESGEGSQPAKSDSGHCAGGSKFSKIEIEQGKIEDTWTPPIIMTVAEGKEDGGVKKFVKAIESHKSFLEETGGLGKIREKRARRKIESIIGNIMIDQCRQNQEKEMEDYVSKIARRELDPYTATEEIIESEMGEG